MARQRILDAAAELAEEEGVMALSLDRVADRAGVSKGGLLNHFNNKEAMMLALMQSSIDAHENAMKARVDSGERYCDAVIANAFEKFDEPGNLMAAFVAAVATDRAAQEMIRKKREGWHLALEADGVPPQQALVLSLALDGLFIGNSLGVTRLTTEEREQLTEGLQALIRPQAEVCMADWFRQALAEIDKEDSDLADLAPTGAI